MILYKYEKGEINMGWRENKKKYSAQYQKDFYATTVIHFNKKYDADIVEHLSKIPNKNQYFRELVLRDMGKK